MTFSKLATCLALLSTSASAQYYLQDDYLSGGNFFDKFSFFTGGDPTHGFVQYKDRNTAQSSGLIRQSSSNVYIGTDSSNVQPNGRPSVRISSTKTYNSGLFILDLQHMPGGVCGTWPAFWTLGPNWPSHGEIDIIEGVHQATVDAITLHTSDSCTLAQTGAYSGNTQSTNCYINAQGQSSNEGCSISSTDSLSYGAGFNNNGGGVYAMEWNSDAISTWFFRRGSIPSDISNGQPNPANWGKPTAQLYGPQGCDIPSHFGSHQIIFDLTYCGDYAGNVWTSSSCAGYADTCNNYVANNPSAFKDMYWSINSLKVYHINGQANRKFMAETPQNLTQHALNQPEGAIPNTVPENTFIPLSPHGKKGAKKRSEWFG